MSEVVRTDTYDWRCQDCPGGYGSGYVPMEALAGHHAAMWGHTVRHAHVVTFKPGPAPGERERDANGNG